MKNSHLFGWACFGAVLPELLRFFKLVAVGQPLPNLNWPLYGVLLFFFVLAAGLFRVAWKPENAFKAIWVGASLPTLIATIVQSVPTRG